MWVPKRRDFTEHPKEEFSRNQRFRAREASHLCYHASRGMDSSYLGLFFTFGQKNAGFEFQLDFLGLGESMCLPHEDWLFV